MSNVNKAEPILKIEDLKVHFKTKNSSALPWAKRKVVKAVNGLNLDVYPGETVGVVGESGCGKSTLARAIVRLVSPAAGKILWMGKDISKVSSRESFDMRKDIQMIFQDPLESLNPRLTIGEIISEPLKIHHPELARSEVKRRVEDIMQKVGLLPNQVNRYPHEFSGGQCQRIGIARALITKPKLIVCDEPVSALDVSVQAQVINLLKQLQNEYGVTLIFIAHDLSVVKHISDRVLVMYLGKAVEIGDCVEIYQRTAHPYSKALLTAIPVPDPDIERNKNVNLLEGDLPSPIDPPSGCVFRTRCSIAEEQCSQTIPSLKGTDQHMVACLKSTIPVEKASSPVLEAV